jgi:carboxypeptidase PM20D1
VHQALTREKVGEAAALYTWAGQDPSLAPLLLLAHQDVVPVEPGTEDAWTHPAFAGDVADGFVWGRGTLDDKVGVVGILEAIESLLEEGFVPRRTILLAFGHDEEISGAKGAGRIVTLLESRHVTPVVALDEGGPITEGIVPGIAAPVAVIGVSEKGYLTIELSVSVPGGHTSTPPPTGAIGVLGAAIAKLEANPMPANLGGAMEEFARYVAPEMAFGLRFVFANAWITRPLLVRALAAAPATNASIRTTTAVTIFNAGVKDNVIPASAKATVNFRVLPGDTSETVLAHVRRVVDDERVQIAVDKASLSEPSPTSSSDSEAFRTLARSIREVFPGVIVAPSLFLGATDGRKYVPIAKDVYRFLPIKMNAEDLKRLHGKNERVGVPAFADAVRFYRCFARAMTE